MSGLVAAIAPEEAAAVSADEVEARAGLILALRRQGIGAHAVLSAIERVPRRLFLSARHHRLAYEDSLIPIECGQSVLAPSYVAMVVQALEIASDHSVLEVGTGSSYQAAVLGHLAARVESLERYRTLVELAEQRIAALRLRSVVIHHADGFAGMRSKAPYDRIVLNGAVKEIPEVLLEQLSHRGMLIAPVGAPDTVQQLVRIARTDAGDIRHVIGSARTVSLTPGLAKRL